MTKLRSHHPTLRNLKWTQKAFDSARHPTAWMHVPRWLRAIALGLIALGLSHRASAAYCEGVSHVACYEGTDPSNRSQDAKYNMAVEGLREARTPQERGLALKAMRDAYDPPLNPNAMNICNSTEFGRQFVQFMNANYPAEGERYLGVSDPRLTNFGPHFFACHVSLITTRGPRLGDGQVILGTIVSPIPINGTFTWTPDRH
jgi:hypothetical protein